MKECSMMNKVAVCFTNFGPYHLARLRALARRLETDGGHLIAYEVAGTEQRYPWQTARADEPFEWITFYPDRALETIPRAECVQAMRSALDRDRPDALGIVGYARPESVAMLGWARRKGRPAVLMSESQEIDHARVWWKEAVKRQLVRRFSAALVGGPRHRDYLVRLGLPSERITLGYNAVDHDRFAQGAEAARNHPEGRHGLPDRPYFLAVNRFVPEKNMLALVRAYAAYRAAAQPLRRWDLVLCGDGPDAARIDALIRQHGLIESVHRPGFLQADELTRYYAFASGFIHPSRMEPWGLVANEAAACGVPLLISERAGCAETLVPEPSGTTGRRFDPANLEEMTAAMTWLAGLPEPLRQALGQRAFEVASSWGPFRFAQGALDAIEIGLRFERLRKGITREGVPA